MCCVYMYTYIYIYMCVVYIVHICSDIYLYIVYMYMYVLNEYMLCILRLNHNFIRIVYTYIAYHIYNIVSFLLCMCIFVCI